MCILHDEVKAHDLRGYLFLTSAVVSPSEAKQTTHPFPLLLLHFGRTTTELVRLHKRIRCRHFGADLLHFGSEQLPLSRYIHVTLINTSSR